MGIKNGEYIWFFWNLTFLKGNESAKVKKKEKNERISFFSQVESYDQKGLAEIEKNLKKERWNNVVLLRMTLWKQKTSRNRLEKAKQK